MKKRKFKVYVLLNVPHPKGGEPFVLMNVEADGVIVQNGCYIFVNQGAITTNPNQPPPAIPIAWYPITSIIEDVTDVNPLTIAPNGSGSIQRMIQ